jgi:omega-6 fatty acid desaturase (delta-12 desaturase)
VIRSNRVVEALTHNILVHTPHHVDSRIPFYRLREAYADLRPAYGAYVHEYRLRWREVRRIFRTCQLYEFDTLTWRRFADVA